MLLKRLNIVKLVRDFALFLGIVSFLGSAIVSLTSCHSKNERAANEIVIGTVAGPEAKLVYEAQKLAMEKLGLSVTIVEFEDYVMPNRALSEGQIDMNIFQHKPFLDLAVQKNGYKFETVAKTFIFPMGMYSKKHDKISDIKHAALIGVPNDPSNQARALYLLEKAKLITLKATKDKPWEVGISDIETNPLELQIKTLDAALLPNALTDLDAAVINSTFAVPNGLYPSKNALIKEDSQSPYANIMVVRSEDAQLPKVLTFIKAYQDDKTVELADKLFDHEAIKAW